METASAAASPMLWRASVRAVAFHRGRAAALWLGALMLPLLYGAVLYAFSDYRRNALALQIPG